MEMMSLVVPMLVMLVAAIALTLVVVLFLPHWLRALLSGEPVPLAVLIGMRVRGNPPGKLVNAYIMLRKQGHDVNMAELEVTCIAQGLQHKMPDEIARAVLKTREER